VRPLGRGPQVASVVAGKRIVDFLDDLRSEIEATAASRRLAEMGVDCSGAAQAGFRGLPDVLVPMAIAEADVHAAHGGTVENDCQLHL
jgi:hypothetical protein